MHSRFGGSGIYILAKCPGALRMYAYAPEEIEGDAAKLGTCKHEASEFAIKTGVNAYDLVGMTFNDIEFTDSMAADIQLYISEHKRLITLYPDAVVLVEVKVTMSSVNNEIFGYVDLALFIPSQRKLILGDYKSGYGIVESSTIQLKHYTVSLLDTYQLWQHVDTIDVFICQPNGDHIDGAIRWSNYTIHDAVNFQKEFQQIYYGAISPDAPLVAGDHCRYCKAGPICRKRIYRTLDLLFPDAPAEVMADGEIMEIFKELPAIKTQIDRIEQLAQTKAAAGVRLDGYKLVRKIARHVCDDEDALVKEIMEHPASNVKDRTTLFNMRLKGKTALKEMPGVPKSVVNKHFHAPENVGTELVRDTDPRPAVGSDSVAGIFEPVRLFEPVEN